MEYQRIEVASRVFSFFFTLVILLSVILLPVVITHPQVQQAWQFVAPPALVEIAPHMVRATLKLVLRFIDIPLQVGSASLDFVTEIWLPIMPPPHTCLGLQMHNFFAVLVFATEHRYPAAGQWLRTTNTSFYLLYELPTVKQYRVTLAQASTNATALAQYNQCYDEFSYGYMATLLVATFVAGRAVLLC